MDIAEDDLLRFTNSGGKTSYAHIICDLAAAVGALKLFVFKNPYFVKQV